jgi:response regulator RpfG family c-di-GMP phosphodiesterase
MAPSAAPVRVLVVDDDDGVRSALARYLQKTGYETIQANGGTEALARLAEGRFEAMLCDLRMPGMSGVQLLPQVLAKDPDLAVIMLTAVGDPESAISCLRVGAVDYLIKPVELEELSHALQYALRKRQLEVERREQEQWLAREVALKTRELAEQSRRIELLALSILSALVDASEPAGPGGRNHPMRVANLSAHVAAELGLAADAIETARMAGRLHDLGRIAARDEQLRRASDPLGHLEPSGDAATVAAHILEPLKQHAALVEIVRLQHEHWDGSGTPEGRRGDAIPVGARIVAAANRYDELTDAASDDARLGTREALERMREDAGRTLDPAVVAALEQVLQRRR